MTTWVRDDRSAAESSGKSGTKVERGAQEGDKVTLDFVGKIDDEAFDGGSGEDASFEVGAGQMIEDFDQGVRGLAEGDSGRVCRNLPGRLRQ